MWVKDIHHFLEVYGMSEGNLTEAFERVVQPEVCDTDKA
jgi:hypothetical protein